MHHFVVASHKVHIWKCEKKTRIESKWNHILRKETTKKNTWKIHWHTRNWNSSQETLEHSIDKTNWRINGSSSSRGYIWSVHEKKNYFHSSSSSSSNHQPTKKTQSTHQKCQKVLRDSPVLQHQLLGCWTVTIKLLKRTKLSLSLTVTRWHAPYTKKTTQTRTER